MHKSSPPLTTKHRRSRDLTYSSDESANLSPPSPPRDSTSTSTDSKDDGPIKTLEADHRNQQGAIQEEETSDNNSDNVQLFGETVVTVATEGSPGLKSTPTTNGNESPVLPLIEVVENVSSDDKSQVGDQKTGSFSDGHSDKDNRDLDSRQNRERSFERSLDNIMDKCSEKSLDLNLSVESWNGSASDNNRTTELTSSSPAVAVKNAKIEKKKKSWYTMLAPTYKSKTDDFRRTFKDIPPDERLIVDYSCALQKDILVQGRMYITQNWICFYANIFRWETVLTIACKDVTAITKEKTARVIPNAIQITSVKEKYFFTSFGARDKTYMMLFRIWQNALMDQPMNSKELWQWIHYSYGEELGVSSSDEEYISPMDDDLQEQLLKDEDFAANVEEITDSEVQTRSTGAALSKDEEEDDESPVDGFMEEEDDEEEDEFEEAQSPVMLNVPRTESLSNYSDTTDDSEAEVICTDHSHLQKLYMDEVFSIPVDKLFECLFTDSSFFRQFVGSRNTFDLELPVWQEEADDDGNRLRTITYTLTLNSIGAKHSFTTEKQVCYKQSEPGNLYVIDTEVCNAGIPYGDAFSVTNRYCLTRVSKTKSRIHITSRINFHRSLIGIVKSMIEKSAMSGLTDYFRSLSANLRREAERHENIRIVHQPKKRTLRRRRKAASVGTEPVAPIRSIERHPPSISASPHRAAGSTIPVREEKASRMNTDTFIRIICFVLILLVIFNALLFYKLWSLESFTNAIYFPHSKDNIIQKYPRSQKEWVQLLKQQMVLQDGELDKWKDVISASIQLIDQVMDQIKGTLVELHDTLDKRKKPEKTTNKHGSQS